MNQPGWVFREREQCCGCGLCAALCPVHAIDMREDVEGFRYAAIDGNRCIHCGKCRNGCPFHPADGFAAMTIPPAAVFGARLKDESALMRSQSGGVFAAIARVVLESGGVVYGAAFDTTGTVVAHRRVETAHDLLPLLGSKYIQSAVDASIYESLRSDATSGRPVLFSGTPCQAAAVCSLWPKGKPSNVIICDLICHSIASPRFWRDYAEEISRKSRKRVTAVRQRDKALGGWHRMVETFALEDGSIVSGKLFARMFSSHLLFRPSCSRCPYTTPNRESDFTLGDFWGIDAVKPEWATDDKGASLVLVRTSVGEAWLRKASSLLDIFESAFGQSDQAQLLAPVRKPCGREAFWGGYRLFGLTWARFALFFLRVRAAVLRRMSKE